MKKLKQIILLMLLTTVCFGQKYYDPELEPTFWDRTYFGGNFSFQFGDLTVINVSPLMGYMVTPKLSVGPGITYQYLKGDAYDYYTGLRYSYDSNIFGWRAFARYNITPMFFAHTEYESLKVEYPNEFGPGLVKDWVPGFFVGGGVFQPVGRRAGIGLTLLFNLLYDEIQSPYNSNLVIRAGVTL